MITLITLITVAIELITVNVRKQDSIDMIKLSNWDKENVFDIKFQNY